MAKCNINGNGENIINENNLAKAAGGWRAAEAALAAENVTSKTSGGERRIKAACMRAAAPSWRRRGIGIKRRMQRGRGGKP